MMTGFPGFLGSALLPRLLARRAAAVRALCLVQPQYLQVALKRVREMEATHPHTAGRIELAEGDITAPDLGLAPDASDSLDDVDEVWHLAAVYDLHVGEEVARRVNVEGTGNVLEFCQSRHTPCRLHHVSTCYVSGAYAGEFTEDALDEGQGFRNHYESTKFEAELLVRRAMAEGLPATVYRPGIVVGDSHTGETEKFDGPYFLAKLLRSQAPLAFFPSFGDPDEVQAGLVPSDFVVTAMDHLSVLDGSVGQTYALTDPRPPTLRQVVDAFARRLGRRVVWVPMPLSLARALVGRVPGVSWLLGLPAEAIDYFTSPTTYSTANTDAALAGTGVECPPFDSYADRLLDFMIDHPGVRSAAMA